MIDHLVVIGAPGGWGKTMLIRTMFANLLPDLTARLSVDVDKEWLFTTGRVLRLHGSQDSLNSYGIRNNLRPIKGLVLFGHNGSSVYQRLADNYKECFRCRTSSMNLR